MAEDTPTPRIGERIYERDPKTGRMKTKVVVAVYENCTMNVGGEKAIIRQAVFTRTVSETLDCRPRR